MRDHTDGWTDPSPALTGFWGTDPTSTIASRRTSPTQGAEITIGRAAALSGSYAVFGSDLNPPTLRPHAGGACGYMQVKGLAKYRSAGRSARPRCSVPTPSTQMRSPATTGTRQNFLDQLVSARPERTPWGCPDRDSGEFGSDAGAAALGEAGGFGAAAWVGQEGDAQPAPAETWAGRGGEGTDCPARQHSILPLRNRHGNGSGSERTEMCSRWNSLVWGAGSRQARPPVAGSRRNGRGARGASRAPG